MQPAAMHMLALLAWAAVFWAFDVLPDYVVGLALIIGWIVFAIVSPEVAVSGFTASPFFLLIGVLGIAASLQAPLDPLGRESAEAMLAALLEEL